MFNPNFSSQFNWIKINFNLLTNFYKIKLDNLTSENSQLGVSNII